MMKRYVLTTETCENPKHTPVYTFLIPEETVARIRELAKDLKPPHSTQGVVVHDLRFTPNEDLPIFVNVAEVVDSVDELLHLLPERHHDFIRSEMNEDDFDIYAQLELSDEELSKFQLKQAISWDYSCYVTPDGFFGIVYYDEEAKTPTYIYVYLNTL